MDHENFWQILDTLVATSEIIIDRPKGTTHPRHPDILYPLDYGYLQNTTSGDGAGIDVWIGSLPQKDITAIILTVDLVKRDSEVKILLGCTPEDSQTILAIHSFTGNLAGILIERKKLTKSKNNLPGQCSVDCFCS